MTTTQTWRKKAFSKNFRTKHQYKFIFQNFLIFESILTLKNDKKPLLRGQSLHYKFLSYLAKNDFLSRFLTSH